MVVPQQLWAGVDAGKSEHHCVVIDADGTRLLSRRVVNDEAVLVELTDAKDAAVELRILTARRTDLEADHTRAINRMHGELLEYFPALEHAFDYSKSKAALILLTTYQTPDGLRRTGVARTAAWLRKHKAYNTSAVAATALEAANSPRTVVPGQDLASTGDDMNVFGTTECLAAISGLTPVPRDHKLYQPTTPNAAAAWQLHRESPLVGVDDPSSTAIRSAPYRYWNTSRGERDTHCIGRGIRCLCERQRKPMRLVHLASHPREDVWRAPSRNPERFSSGLRKARARSLNSRAQIRPRFTARGSTSTDLLL